MHKKRVSIKIAVMLFILMLVSVYCSKYCFALEADLEQIEYTDQYIKWLEIPDEERKDYIQPFPFVTELKEETRKIENRSLLNAKLGVTYSQKYDLRDYINLEVKDQKQTNQCWAFSINSVVESNIAKITGEDSPNLSERYLEYATTREFLDGINKIGYNREVNSGGNAYISLGFYTSGQGPILEKEMPFENNIEKISLGEIQNKNAVKQIEEYVTIPGIYKNYKADGSISYSNGGSTNYSEAQVETIRKTIKQHIIDYGAINACTYTPTTKEEAQKYYASTDGKYITSYCCKDNLVANHAITIIGWDDNYAIENFNSNNRPSKPGAYLVLNSYGEEIHENGVYYISYEDYFIETLLTSVLKTSNIDYDNIYQHDEYGYSISLPWINSSQQLLNEIFVANVFERDKTKTEKLTEISVYTEGITNIDLYVNASSDDLKISNLVKVKSGVNFSETGYHTIQLDTPIRLTGDKFAIVALYKNSSEAVRTPLELNWLSNLDTLNITEDKIPEYWNFVASSTGESFISVNGTNWQDLTTLYKDTNFCIKAFTVDESKVHVTGIQLDKKELSLKVGDIETLTATLQPLNVTNGKVNWHNNNSDVIKLVEANANEIDGKVVHDLKIEALSSGTAVITVTTEDGNYTASCNITVEKVEQEPTKVAVTGISLNKTSATLKVGETVTLTHTITPSNATNKNVIWKSSDANIATVANGLVTAKTAGTAKITVTTEDGNYIASCNITVEKVEQEPTKVAVTGISLNKTSATLKVGETVTLTHTITPSNATNKNVTWKSSNENVASVNSNGVVTAKTKGTAIITVTTEDGGFYKTCTVNVEEKSSLEKFESNVYTIEKEYIYKIPTNTTKKQFTNNIIANVEYKIYDATGKEISNDDTLITTAMKLKVENKEYTLVVRGDLNGDGKLSVTDLTKMKFHLVNLQKLDNAYLKASDLNYDGNTSVTDLVMIKRSLVGFSI